MTKITTEHLARNACVYIRQSTADQLAHIHESRRRQYGLVDRAKQLGWSNAEVIDDDLGRSGGGIARPGFERLLATICDGRVGAVLAIEASRLARNGRDWHTLIEFCGLVGTLIVDEDGIYDPRHPNDRLLLGMKGTMSELEIDVPPALAGSAEAEGAPRRAGPRWRRRLCEDRSRSHREESGQTRAARPAAGLRQVRRAAKCKTGAHLVERGVHRAAGQVAPRRGARRGVATAGLQHRTQHPDHSDLCRGGW